ncbi:hypothetical protein D3C75_831200 [compost metagenome]
MAGLVVEDRLELAVGEGLPRGRCSPLIRREDIGRASCANDAGHLILGREGVGHVAKDRIVQTVPDEENGEVGE